MKRAKAPPLPDTTDPVVVNHLVGTATAAVTRDTCAQRATAMNAELWTFTEVAGDADTCDISSWAQLSNADFDTGAVTQVPDTSVCGPCPSVAPAAGAWPGVDAAASNNAFGTHQPFGLQCWPKKATAASPSVLELMDCGSSVVQTTTAGWPGTCNNLEDRSTAATESDCRAQCQADPFCSVWMWATPTGQTDPQCFAGVGNQCWTQTVNPTVSSVTTAERLQHGLVQVLKDDVNGGVLEGLQQQFAEDVTLNGEALSAAAQKENCRIICHSNVLCTFWQSYYKDGTATTGQGLGCWTESPGVDAAGRGGATGYVQYPTTTSAFAVGDDAIPYITGGQYIQHYCQTPTLPQRPNPTTTTTTTTVVPAAAIPPTPAPSGGFMNPWGYMAIVAALLVALAAAVLLMMGQQKKPPKPAKRGLPKMKVKPEPPAPPAPPQPVVPLMAAQPIMVTPTIPQPLTMTTIQQPTTIAAPAIAQPLQMATYAGAPQVRPY